MQPMNIAKKGLWRSKLIFMCHGPSHPATFPKISSENPATSDSVLRADDFLGGKGYWNVVVCYASAEQCEDVVKHDFYQQLDVVIHKTGSLVVVLSDFNARLGKAVSKVVGQLVYHSQPVTMVLD